MHGALLGLLKRCGRRARLRRPTGILCRVSPSSALGYGREPTATPAAFGLDPAVAFGYGAAAPEKRAEPSHHHGGRSERSAATWRCGDGAIPARIAGAARRRARECWRSFGRARHTREDARLVALQAPRPGVREAGRERPLPNGRPAGL